MMNQKFWIVLLGLLLLSFPAWGLEQAKIIDYENILLNDTGLSDIPKLVNAISRIEPLVIGKAKIEKNAEYYLAATRLGIYYHNVAANGLKKGYRGYSKKAYEILNKITRDPNFIEELKPIALPYLGSSRAIMGDENTNPVNKIKYVQEGAAILDEAVSKYNNISYFPLFMRGNVFVALPEFFKKDGVAFQDYRELDQWNKRDPSRIPEGVMALVYYNLGNCFKKQKKLAMAMEYWKLAYQMDPDGSTGKNAKKMLEIFGE